MAPIDIAVGGGLNEVPPGVVHSEGHRSRGRDERDAHKSYSHAVLCPQQKGQIRMSTDVMNRIWWREDLATMEKFIAIALADASSDDGMCWPAVATIALKCSCSERTVQNAVKSLCAKNLLRKHERRDQSSYYFFNLDNLPLVERPRRSKERGFVTVKDTGAADSPQLFGTGESGSVTGESGSMTGESPAPRNIKETSLETSDRLSGVFDAKTPASLIGDYEPQLPVKVASIIDYVEMGWSQLKSEYPGIAGIRKIDDGLAHTIKTRTEQHRLKGESDEDLWNRVFSEIRSSRFLQGRVPPNAGRESPFKLTLSWLVKAAMFREVINGKYSRSADDGRDTDRSGRPLSQADQAAADAIRSLQARDQQRRG